MKNNLLPLCLTGVFFVVTVACGGLLWKYNGALHQIQQTQAKINSLNNARAMVNSLVNDVVEYSKRNPAIEPILQPFINVPAKTATPVPAGKPPGK